MSTVNVRGTAVPALGYGTWELEGEDCLRGVATALELGYRHVPREDVFLTTKVWNSRLEPERVRTSTEERWTPCWRPAASTGSC